TWTDQSVPVENSLLLAQALKKAGVSLEIHIYPSGRHGLSLATDEVSNSTGDCLVPHCQGWMELAKEWIKEKDRE
ncbi:MAG: alpha/beta hydrolase, partial [Enterocloster citroniae]|nr:alpha/beta hydrolase [Enterocloster citroniae]